ncbi:hypothetical protein [Aureivirga marina]|uniref:hypothetical protein n=1 Tax=Aureivirga marina TaxID=1182451 RepID=UPI0018CA57E9|nr:hypothetical protein [Aureivirga marina]
MREVVEIENNKELIAKLKQEIFLLEEELKQVSFELNGFQHEIRMVLHEEIKHINFLEKLYKEQKREKKEKRRKQKKKGKNYTEPTKLLSKSTEKNDDSTNQVVKKNLKKLYKESVVKVHPDKYANESEETQQKAQELTTELNDLYQKGDLRELEHLYNHILSGNAFISVREDVETIENPTSMVKYLQHQKSKIEEELQEEKESHLYFVLKNYENPLSYIYELKIYFEDRIMKLEKRTRFKKLKK